MTRLGSVGDDILCEQSLIVAQSRIQVEARGRDDKDSVGSGCDSRGDSCCRERTVVTAFAYIRCSWRFEELVKMTTAA